MATNSKNKKSISIRDKRIVDIATGKKLGDKSRMHANISEDHILNIIDSARKYGIDPYTALAINLQESGFSDEHERNPLRLDPKQIDIDTYEELVSNPISGSMRYMKNKFDYARRLGKESEEDIIQAWNGYGTIKGKGRMYGIDTNVNPINMKLNPVYGKRIVNLRDSVIKANPDIVKMVDKYKSGGKLNSTAMNSKLPCPGSKIRSQGQGLGLGTGQGSGPINRGQRKRYLLELYDDEVYSLGGWLKENVGNILQTVGGAGLTVFGGPAGAAAGVGMLASGLGGIAGNAFAEEPDVIKPNPIIMPRTVGKEGMTPNVMSFKRGGGLSSISVNKAKEMLKNPPHGKKLTEKQRKAFQAIAHGWHPSYEEGGMLEPIEYKKGGGIHIKAKNKGKFTASAKKAGRSVQAHARAVLKDPNATPLQKKRANFARNAKKFKHEYGGEMNDELFNNDLIELKGPSHEQGGIQFTPDAELEGGETVYGNVVNSDSIWITNEIAEAYGLPKGAIGKSVAEYSKVVNKKYEGRDVDPFAMKSKEIELSNLSHMSEELANMYEREGNQFQLGGSYGTQKNPLKLNEAVVTADKQMYTDWKNRISPWIDMNYNPNEMRPNADNIGNSLLGYDIQPNELRPTSNLGATVPDRSSRGIREIGKNVKWGDVATTALGLAPVAIGAFQAARAAKEKPDVVNLGRLHYDPMHPEFIDPAYQLRGVEDVYATGNEQMAQQSRTDWMRRRIQSATEEAKAKSGVLGSVQAANTQMLNQARQMNTQGRMQTDMFNAQMGLQQENINAANKGAWQTNRDYQINNLATMAGEYARDIRLEKADEEYRKRWLDVVGDMFGGQKLDPATLAWQNTGQGLGVPTTSYVYNTPSVRLPPVQQQTPVQYKDPYLSSPNRDRYGLNINNYRMPYARFNPYGRIKWGA